MEQPRIYTSLIATINYLIALAINVKLTVSIAISFLMAYIILEILFGESNEREFCSQICEPKENPIDVAIFTAFSSSILTLLIVAIENILN